MLSASSPRRPLPAGLVRPKVLYLTFNVRYMNPTRERLFDALSRASDLTAYGPGYCNADVLAQGVSRFVERFGPYDFVVTDEYVLQDFDLANPKRNRFVNHACRFDRSLLIQALEWREFLSSYQGRRIITLMQSDFYNFSQRHIERLGRLGDYYITWGTGMMISTTSADRSSVREAGIDGQICKRWTDRYLDFARANEERIIECPHFVSAAESSDVRLERRSKRWSVLGAEYDARFMVREGLTSSGISWLGDGFRYVHAAGQALRINVYNKYWSISLLQWMARRALQHSRYGFRCGSVLRWPVRKFFEIPAAGSVLVCHEPAGFEALGFTHMENALTCDAGDIAEVHRWLSTHTSTAQSMADEGRRLVLEKHSVEARAEQIGVSLNRILDKQFFGARWCRGNFELMGMPAPTRAARPVSVH